MWQVYMETVAGEDEQAWGGALRISQHSTKNKVLILHAVHRCFGFLLSLKKRGCAIQIRGGEIKVDCIHV